MEFLDTKKNLPLYKIIGLKPLIFEMKHQENTLAKPICRLPHSLIWTLKHKKFARKD